MSDALKPVLERQMEVYAGFLEHTDFQVGRLIDAMESIGALHQQVASHYFEMAGNRGIYFQGWSAVTRHSTPWLPNEELPALDDDVWELYDGRTDWTQARDLVADHPDKLAALQ